MAKETWVYLMRDLRSGFIKIGESTNPEYRERTLQAEQPLIELIHAWQGTSDDEKQLHKFFANKRIRGEWFELDKVDLGVIEDYFFDNIQYFTRKTGAQIFQNTLNIYHKYWRTEAKRRLILTRSFYN